LRAASLRKQSGDQKGAIGKYERVLNQNPENIEAMTEKADLQVATKDWNAAVKSYEELHAKKAPTAETSVALAEAYRNTQSK
jgi:lipopolysaccharide biosynthesis regulator YciM